MSSEITLLLTRDFGVQSINTSFDAEFASRPAQAECARGTRALFAGEKRLVQSCVPVVKTRDSPSLYLTDGSKIEVFW